MVWLFFAILVFVLSPYVGKQLDIAKKKDIEYEQYIRDHSQR